LPCPEIEKTERSLWENGLFLFPGFFVPANLHALPDFAFGLLKIGESKPSDGSSERVKSIAKSAEKNDWSSFNKFGEKIECIKEWHIVTYYIMACS